MGFRLTGPLAQFSRSDLVADIAGRLVAAFAQNVEARLSGSGTAAPAAELNAGSLFCRCSSTVSELPCAAFSAVTPNR